MRVLLFLCAMALLGAVARADCGPECDPPDPELVKRLDEQEHMIDDLLTKTENVIHEMDKLHDDREHAEIDSQNMLHRIERSTGEHHCKHHEFACGGTEDDCVPNLVVCDHKKDCVNGHDESDSICKLKHEVGHSWSGHFVFYNCSNNIYSDLKFVLKKFEPRKDMQSMADMEGILYWTDITHAGVEEHDALPYKGHFLFATGTAEFIVHYGGRVLDERFYLLPGLDEILRYDIYIEHGGSLCGRAYLEHGSWNDDDDHRDDDHH